MKNIVFLLIIVLVACERSNFYEILNNFKFENLHFVGNETVDLEEVSKSFNLTIATLPLLYEKALFVVIEEHLKKQIEPNTITTSTNYPWKRPYPIQMHFQSDFRIIIVFKLALKQFHWDLYEYSIDYEEPSFNLKNLKKFGNKTFEIALFDLSNFVNSKYLNEIFDSISFINQSLSHYQYSILNFFFILEEDLCVCQTLTELLSIKNEILNSLYKFEINPNMIKFEFHTVQRQAIIDWWTYVMTKHQFPYKFNITKNSSLTLSNTEDCLISGDGNNKKKSLMIINIEKSFVTLSLNFTSSDPFLPGTISELSTHTIQNCHLQIGSLNLGLTSPLDFLNSYLQQLKIDYPFVEIPYDCLQEGHFLTISGYKFIGTGNTEKCYNDITKYFKNNLKFAMEREKLVEFYSFMNLLEIVFFIKIEDVSLDHPNLHEPQNYIKFMRSLEKQLKKFISNGDIDIKYSFLPIYLDAMLNLLFDKVIQDCQFLFGGRAIVHSEGKSLSEILMLLHSVYNQELASLINKKIPLVFGLISSDLNKQINFFKNRTFLVLIALSAILTTTLLIGLCKRTKQINFKFKET